MSTASPPPQATAGVIAPPPLLALTALLGGLGAQWAAPLGYVAQIETGVRYTIAAVLAVLALLLFALAVGGFVRAGTAVQTRRESTHLVTTGVYAHVRNPIYVAFALVLLSVAFAAAADWLLLATALFALVIHWGVVRREERYLAAKFGEEYRAYKARVPRYGWRF